MRIIYLYRVLPNATGLYLRKPLHLVFPHWRERQVGYLVR